MASKGRKILAIIFSAATIVSILIIGYSSIYYVELSLALRSVSAHVKDLRVELVSEQHILISTNVVMNNTTPFQFTWLWVEENVYVNETRVGTKYDVFPENHPLIIPPRTETNHTTEIHVYFTTRSEIAELILNPSVTKTWVAIVDLYCDAPLTGRTKISTSASIETR